MTRSTINSYQKTAATVVPELDLNDPLVDDAALLAIMPWAGAKFTVTKIPFSQFVSETGYAGKHPLGNLGQEYVMKVGQVATTGALNVFLRTAISAIDISSGVAGWFMFVPTASRAGLSSSVTKLHFANTSLADYVRYKNQVGTSVKDDTWELIGGLVEGTLTPTGSGGTDEYFDYAADAGGQDFTAVDFFETNIHQVDSVAATYYFTSPFYGAKRRPTFMLEQDDLNLDTDIWIEDCETYGFKTGLNAISGNVDSGGGRPTTAEMKTYLDSGHAVYCHGASGMTGTLDGDPNGTAGAQIDSELAFWRAFYPEVLDDTTLMHQALPEGQVNNALRAYMRSLGYKTVRATGSLVYHSLIAQSEYGDIGDYLDVPSFEIGTVIGTPGAIAAHIDAMIKHGQDNVLYIHAYAANRAEAQAALAHLKLRRDQGLCEVMPRHEWYEKSIAQYGKRSAV